MAGWHGNGNLAVIDSSRSLRNEMQRGRSDTDTECLERGEREQRRASPPAAAAIGNANSKCPAKLIIFQPQSSKFSMQLVQRMSHGLQRNPGLAVQFQALQEGLFAFPVLEY